METEKDQSGYAESTQRAKMEKPEEAAAADAVREGGAIEGVYTRGDVGAEAGEEVENEDREDLRVADAEAELDLDPIVGKSLRSGPDSNKMPE